MARNATNPLATALDKRIRAMVDETVATAVREEVRQALREELAGLFGEMAGTAAPAAPRAAAREKVRAAPAKKAAAVAKKGPGRPGRPKTSDVASSPETKCGVADCKRAYRSRGYCAAHYQAARKYGWPMPAPSNFVPPPRPARGRPPRASA